MVGITSVKTGFIGASIKKAVSLGKLRGVFPLTCTRTPCHGFRRCGGVEKLARAHRNCTKVRHCPCV